MKKLLLISIYLTVGFTNTNTSGGKEISFSNTPCLTEEQRIEIREILEENKRMLQEDGILPDEFETRIPMNFEWPLRAADHYEHYDYWSISAYVDHNPSIGQLMDYNCGARTYDMQGYNHQGTDIFTIPYPWRMMDNMEVEIVAAAPGVILYKSDGNYDTNCGEGGTNWNSVYIQHNDGSEAWYGHMKRFSLTSKNVGESVETGEFLGVVGSSGFSTGPHIHFELWDYISVNNYVLIDPFEGECNSTLDDSAWENQIGYSNAGFLALSTHSFGPWYPACPQREIPNEKQIFSPGELMSMVAFFRDLSPGMSFNFRLWNPSGEFVDEITFYHQGFLWYYAYYWWWYNLPMNAEPGEWTYTLEFQNIVHEYNFTVGEAGCTDPFSVNFNQNAIQDDGSCDFCRGSQVEVQIVYDDYPEETWWTLNEGTNKTVKLSKQYDTEPGWSGCLQPGEYVFNVFDDYGDGILDGSISLIIDNETVFMAAQFGYDDLHAFNISGIETGDVNQDGTVNIQDIILLVNFILNNTEPGNFEYNLADLNTDGLLNVNDIILMVFIIINE